MKQRRSSARTPAKRTGARADGVMPARGKPLDEIGDVAALTAMLRQRRQALADTVSSSQQYWTVVHRMLEARLALEQAEDRFRELYDFIPIPFLVLDHSLRIASANSAAAELCGRENVGRGRPVQLLIEDGYRELSGSLRAARPASQLEVQLRSAKGVIPAQVSALTAEDPILPTARSHYLAIVDVSGVRKLAEERRALDAEQQRVTEVERAARQAEKAKDAFIAILSHELRTPLTPILAAVAAADSEPLPPRARHAITVIRRNVLAEVQLIDDLLDVARIRQGRFRIERDPFALHELLMQSVEDWRSDAAHRGLEIDVELRARDDLVDADQARIAQVLRNVLANAAKFTDRGGRVTVATTDAEDRIRVTVADTGVGMTRSQLEHLFEKATPVRQPLDRRTGLGLGLAISRDILRAHGGWIQVKSGGPGRGTSVEIELPIMKADDPRRAQPRRPAVAAGSPPASRPPERPTEHPPAGAQPALPPVGNGKRRVLLVEDHEDSAATLSMVLSISGYDVKVARSLAQAREMAGDCDVVVSDISLPDGSGLDLLRELRQHREVPAVALSGFGTEDDFRLSREAGFTDHLVKPVDVPRLLASLERLTTATSSN